MKKKFNEIKLIQSFIHGVLIDRRLKYVIFIKKNNINKLHFFCLINDIILIKILLELDSIQTYVRKSFFWDLQFKLNHA